MALDTAQKANSKVAKMNKGNEGESRFDPELLHSIGTKSKPVDLAICFYRQKRKMVKGG